LELQISGYLRNDVRAKNKNAKQRRKRRDIQSKVAPAPRGHGGQGPEKEILLLSRGKAKEEEGGGGLSPRLFWWRRSAARGIIVTTIYTNNFTAVITNFLPLYAAL
jgi:hypothetical protein